MKATPLTALPIWLSTVFFMSDSFNAFESAAEPAAMPAFKAGFAERDVTPAIGMEVPGNYVKIFHKKLHDPCKVRAAVFDDGQLRVALVGVDALIVPRQIVEAARNDIQRQCGIAGTAVLIGASHSHSSGPTGMVQPGQYDHAPDFVRSLAYEHSSCADAGYLDRVRREIVAAVCLANSNAAPARCGAGTGKEDKVAFNRRFHMKNGLTFTHPGKGNSDIEVVAGPTDPTVGVLGAWDKDGKLLGCVVNFACHATTSPDGISANWIYDLERVIRGTFGPQTTVVFLQGDCGDVTQVDNLTSAAERPGDSSSRFVGGRVGAEAVKVLLSMQPGDLGPLAVRSKMLRLKHRIPEPERVRQCTELARKSPPPKEQTGWVFAKEIVLLSALLEREPVAEVEIQAIQVGPAVFLANPGETFCQFGLELRARSPFPFTFPVELANGCVGYIPTEEALGEHGGGYETRLTSYSNLEPAAGQLMTQAALEMASQLKPGTVPTPPQAPRFKAPWSYGNVPPEVK